MASFSKFLKVDPNMLHLSDFYPPQGALIPVVSTLLFCVISFYFFKWLSGDITVPIRDVTKTHSWKIIQVSSRAWYCSICECLLMNGIGVYCDYCGVCSDTVCIKQANLKLSCKAITSKSEVHLHHWVKGNLPLGAICDVCSEDCAMEPGLVDFECCWCHRAVHTECLSKLPKECDFGPFRNMIVPPWCVQVAKRKSSIHRHMLLRGVQHPGWERWRPLIVVANRISGNSEGEAILSEFRRHLNPAQVLDLAERSPAAALQWGVLVAPEKINVLAAGGDGTVAWMLSTVHKLDLDPQPAVAILPLGTGNDLSRVLGWGRQNPPELNISEILTKISDAQTVDIDRWKIEISPHRHLANLGIRMPRKISYMYNYISVGVDAQVALDFHKARSSRFYLFGSRIFNKLLYLGFGTQQVVTADCRNLEQRLDLFLDGRKVVLPQLESIVILNISSWGAGVDLWSMTGEEARQSYNDGVLEVLGISSSFHIAQLQVGLSKPYSFGQAKKIEVNLKASAPVQIDGEPWEQHPTHISISLVDKAKVLVNVEKNNQH